MLVVLPPFVNYSLTNSMLEPLALGITVVLIPDYNPGDFSAYVKKYRPNHVNSIPAYWEAAFKHGATSPSDFSCLKHLYYGGESMDSGSEETISEWLLEQGSQNPLNKGFGETELVSSATLTFAENNLPGSVGIPLPMINVKTVEPGTLGEHSFGEVGEICFSGPTLMLGYYGNEAATNEVVKVHEDGQRWLHTGDLGYVNEDGVVFLTGRIKRIVMTKGRDGQVTKIFPDRIEKVVATHPAVRVCCAIGVPDEERVNFPKAVVELNDGRTPSPELATEIIGSCRDALPEYMVPEEVEFTESLPRTERGKVDYRAVEEMIKSGQNEE
ncbi:MAG: fatty acid--CoA ligase family protein [Olegusella sp.]|nr:fatty acid--CoA ligase family protein [Olegusella sp.]